MRRAILLGLLPAVLACGGGVNLSSEIGRPHPVPEPPVHKVEVPEVVGTDRAAREVVAAADSFQGMRLRDQAWLSDQELMDQLAAADVVCLGGDPRSARDHWAAVQLAWSLERRAGAAGRLFAVGLEAFSADEQALLDAFLARQIDERTLLRQIDWPAPPGVDFGYYRPLLQLGTRLGVPMVALGAERYLAQKIEREGIDSLEPREKKRLPELDFAVRAHRQWFERRPASTGAARDHGYAVTVVKAETLADGAVRYVEQSQPARQLLVVANLEQCQHGSVPDRVLRRVSSCRTTSVRVADSVSGQEARWAGFDFALVVDREP